MSDQKMEEFLVNAAKYVDERRQGNFTHDKDNLVICATEGGYPCDICPRGKICGQMNCLAFYIWFRKKWRNLQKHIPVRKKERDERK